MKFIPGKVALIKTATRGRWGDQALNDLLMGLGVDLERMIIDKHLNLLFLTSYRENPQPDAILNLTLILIIGKNIA